MKPLNQNVVVKRDESEEEKTPGGIIKPKNDSDILSTAKVIAVSEEIREPKIKVGDNVVLSKYCGEEVRVGTDEYLVVPYNDILGLA